MPVMDHRLGGAGIQSRLANFPVRGIQQFPDAGFVAHTTCEDAVPIEKHTQSLRLCEVVASNARQFCAKKGATIGDAVRPMDFL